MIDIPNNIIRYYIIVCVCQAFNADFSSAFNKLANIVLRVFPGSSLLGVL